MNYFEGFEKQGIEIVWKIDPESLTTNEYLTIAGAMEETIKRDQVFIPNSEDKPYLGYFETAVKSFIVYELADFHYRGRDKQKMNIHMDKVIYTDKTKTKIEECKSYRVLFSRYLAKKRRKKI